MKFLIMILIVLTSFSVKAISPSDSKAGDIIVNAFNKYIHVTFDGTRLIERKNNIEIRGAWFPQVSMIPFDVGFIHTQQLLPSLGITPSMFRPKSGIQLNGLQKKFLEDTRDGVTYFDFYKEKIIFNTNLVFNDGNNSQTFPSVFQPDEMYSNIVIVDLSSLKVEKRLPIGTVKAFKVVGDFLYTISHKSDVFRINLKSYKIERLNNEPIHWMFPTFVVTSNHQVYLATTEHKFENTPTKLKSSRLYRLEHGKVSEVATLPSEHLRNLVVESNGKLYFLLTNSKLWSVDLSSGKSLTYELPFKEKTLNLSESFFVKLSEDTFAFTERSNNDTIRLFITNSNLKLLAEHYLYDIDMLWNLSTREQPYGNQKL
ncbi:hypothetical protein MT391_19150 [Vibrio sp. 1-Bac 57]